MCSTGLTACSSNSEADAPAPTVTASETSTPTQVVSKAPKPEVATGPTPEAAESAAPDIERTPLREWQGIGMLDNLPEDHGEKNLWDREFIMLNDPECNLTTDHIAGNTVYGNFAKTGEDLMKALNVVGSMYSDYTVPGNEKKADVLIDGLTSYHSPEAAGALKGFIRIAFLEGIYMSCSPEVCNHRFDNAAVT